MFNFIIINLTIFVKQLIWKFVDNNGNCRIEDII